MEVISAVISKVLILLLEKKRKKFLLQMESAKLRTLCAHLPYVPCVLLVPVPHLSRVLADLVPHVTCILYALVLHVPRASRAVFFSRALIAVLPHVSHALGATCLTWSAFCILSFHTCFHASRALVYVVPPVLYALHALVSWVHVLKTWCVSSTLYAKLFSCLTWFILIYFQLVSFFRKVAIVKINAVCG